MSAGFENLNVWKRSVGLAAEIYIYFKQCKDYGFKDQITRSALSIPSNIAEGYERDYDKEKQRYYSIAKGSAGELRTQIIIGIKINYINKEKGNTWIQETREISAMIIGLRKSIRSNQL